LACTPSLVTEFLRHAALHTKTSHTLGEFLNISLELVRSLSQQIIFLLQQIEDGPRPLGIRLLRSRAIFAQTCEFTLQSANALLHDINAAGDHVRAHGHRSLDLGLDFTQLVMPIQPRLQQLETMR
jgi:uncharacterized protein (DUF885 family)